MKSSLISSLLLAAAGTAVAQDYTQSAAFTISVIDAADSSNNGFVVSSCHSGAAIEGMCLGPPAAAGSAPPEYGTYYLNTTTYNNVSGAETGVLVWNLPYTGGNGPGLESEPLSLLYTTGSNVAAALFQPSEANIQVGFDGDNKLFAVAQFDDSTFTSTANPTPQQPFALYHWEACYTYTEGYYYFAVAWRTAGVPSNPTCSAVNLTRTFI